MGWLGGAVGVGVGMGVGVGEISVFQTQRNQDPEGRGVVGEATVACMGLVMGDRVMRIAMCSCRHQFPPIFLNPFPAPLFHHHHHHHHPYSLGSGT